MKQGTNIPTHVTSRILHIGFLDAGLCKEEVLFEWFNAFSHINQGSPDRKSNHAVNPDDVQRESMN